MECKGIEFRRFFWNALLMVDIVKFIRGVNLAEKQAKLAVFAKNRRNPTEMQGKFWIKMASGPEIEQVRAKPPVGREQKLEVGS